MFHCPTAVEGLSDPSLDQGCPLLASGSLRNRQPEAGSLICQQSPAWDFSCDVVCVYVCLLELAYRRVLVHLCACEWSVALYKRVQVCVSIFHTFGCAALLGTCDCCALHRMFDGMYLTDAAHSGVFQLETCNL
jgi:hypothetical protein